MADLSKFGVPLNGQRLGILQPKISHRFRVVFSNFGDGTGLYELTQNVMSVTRPSIEHEVVTVDAYVSKAYYAGKHEWSTVEIMLRDDITNSVVAKVGQQIQKQMNHHEQTSAVAGVNYKFDVEIHALDGTNNEELESWKLESCFLSNTKYGDVDYASSDPVTVTLTIRCDNATHLAGPNTNDGTTAGGDPFPNTPSPTGGTTVG